MHTKKEWYNFPRIGPCEACGKRVRRQAHHVVRKQDFVRYYPERRYDISNRMLVGTFCCHYAHSNYGVRDTRILYSKVSDAAKDFAVEVLGGKGPAENYWRRYYKDVPRDL